MSANRYSRLYRIHAPASLCEHCPSCQARRRLHAQHHEHGVLETRKVPGSFEPPAMTEVKDFALSKSDLDVINPGPGEYVHVMEGQRHGYRNLTIGITYTAPGGAPPMHTYLGEETDVLLKEQKVLYALGDELFVQEGRLPCISCGS